MFARDVVCYLLAGWRDRRARLAGRVRLGARGPVAVPCDRYDRYATVTPGMSVRGVGGYGCGRQACLRGVVGGYGAVRTTVRLPYPTPQKSRTQGERLPSFISLPTFPWTSQHFRYTYTPHTHQHEHSHGNVSGTRA